MVLFGSAPVTKHNDAAKDLYSLEIPTGWVNAQFLHLHFLINLDSPLAYHDCSVKRLLDPESCPNNTIRTTYTSCNEFECSDVPTFCSYQSPPCITVNNNTKLPYAECTCPVNVANPVNGECFHVLLNHDDFTLTISNGRNILTAIYDGFPNAGCANSLAFESFPENVSGVMMFSGSRYAFPAHLVDPLKNVLALCFPNTTWAPGVQFHGETPYYLLLHLDIDIRSFFVLYSTTRKARFFRILHWCQCYIA